MPSPSLPWLFVSMLVLGASPVNPPLEHPPVLPATLAQTVLISTGAQWRYLDNGSDQGTAWQATGFDDSSWAAGAAELGYGDGGEATVVSFGPSSANKFITTYFRHSFQVASTTGLTIGSLRLLRDDGAVVYLNGQELLRSNMPVGAINYQTQAMSAVSGGGETTFSDFSIDPALLQVGNNVIAVELHQFRPNSSDISLDLELTVSDDPVSMVRGPYLQQGTTSGMTVCWRTNGGSDALVKYGTDPNQLNQQVASANIQFDHKITLPNLQADTRYYYSVGSSSQTFAGPDLQHTFRTSPLNSATTSTRIWVIGDSGTANTVAQSVRDAYLNFTGEVETDVWLMLGDNAYNSGTDTEYQAAVFDMYPTLLRQTPVCSTFGNHDSFSANGVSQTGTYFDIFKFPSQAEAGGLASGTEAYYAFDYGDIHFICLDSMHNDRQVGGAMYQWLQADLANTTADWVIAFWHHPPYTKGSHDSDNPADSAGRMQDMRQRFLPVLEAGGVDLVLSGHSHSYERSYLLDGHYGLSNTLTPAMILDAGDGGSSSDGAYIKASPGQAAHEGAVYAVAGSSGKATPAPLNHPAMVVSLLQWGSMVIDIQGNRLDGLFLNNLGTALDEFTILKNFEPALKRDVHGVSVTTGGTQNLSLNAGVAHGLRKYWIFDNDAVSGTAPGVTMAPGVNIPLNPDVFTDFVISQTHLGGGVPTFVGWKGSLDIGGKAQAAILVSIINDPAVVGVSIFHSYLVYDDLNNYYFTSNPVRLRLLP